MGFHKMCTNTDEINTRYRQKAPPISIYVFRIFRLSAFNIIITPSGQKWELQLGKANKQVPIGAGFILPHSYSVQEKPWQGCQGCDLDSKLKYL